MMQPSRTLRLLSWSIVVVFSSSACSDQGNVTHETHTSGPSLAQSDLKVPHVEASRPSPKQLPVENKFESCLNSGQASHGIFRYVFECYKNEYGRVDAELNGVYEEKIKKLDKSKRIYLRKLQRSWIIERNKACILVNEEKSALQADDEKFEEMSCLILTTEKRIEFLRNY